MPNYTYKCPEGHIMELRVSYEDFRPLIECHGFGGPCRWSAGVVFEPIPFVVKAPRDTQ